MVKGDYILIFDWLIGDQNLSDKQKLLLAKIENLDRDRGCYASNSYFANLLHTTKGTISKLISDLGAKGYIDVDIERNDNNMVVGRTITINTTLWAKRTIPMVKKGKDINTDLKSNINKRLDLFKKDVRTFIQYDKEVLDEFINYWTELNPSKTKFRREGEKFFDIARRLSTWAKNSKEYKKKKTSTTLANYKLDSTGKFFRAWCGKCNTSESYSNFEIHGDSRCCSSSLSPTKGG